MNQPIPEPKGRRGPVILLAVYQAAFLLAGMGILLVRLFRRKGMPGLRERLAWYPDELLRNLKALCRPIWIHLVSVGEALAAEPLIQEMRRRDPDRNWLITTVTPTGREVAGRLIRDGRDRLLYLPWDLGIVVRRAVEAIDPGLFISFETELWPVLFHHLAKRGVPVVVVNGRLSPVSYRRYLWARFFMQRALEPVRLFLTQSPQDARRYAAIGAAKDRILVTGNIKWDLKPASENGKGPAGKNPLREALGLSPEDVLWVAGSTHPGEEKLILKVYGRLKPEHPHLRLLLAPRHPERVPEVEQQVKQAGWSSLRRSRCEEDVPAGSKDPILLLDTLGELTAFYRACDLVFMGGSLVPIGGHNLVEPAAFRRPIVTGSHLHNFQAISESLRQAGGIAVVESVEELEKTVRHLIENPRAREELGRRAFAVIQEHRGATHRTVECILGMMNRRSLDEARL